MKIKDFLEVESKGNIEYEIIDTSKEIYERTSKTYDYKEEILKDKNFRNRQIKEFYYKTFIDEMNIVLQIII